MSGTSLDGVDGVLVEFSGNARRVLANASRPFDAAFRSELLALNTPSHNELHRAALAGNRIAQVYAEVVDALCQSRADLSRTSIRAIGAHGQTVRHQPGPGAGGIGTTGYSWQLNNPSLLAELTGIDVVADFRSRDLAAGGQGAPLVPAFHQAAFGRDDGSVAALNLGGIANLSVLRGPASEPVLGFDCGPGNALMDAWCQRHQGHAFDQDGAWAASGTLLPALLQHLHEEPYLSLPPPKSTGRDLFSQAWLDGKLAAFSEALPQDIQNTLTEFTACVCASSALRHARHCTTLVVCGGGAFNNHLMRRLQHHLPGVEVLTSDRFGLPPLQVEATAFAWLARQTIARQPGNLPSVTGAAGLRVLGAVYPA